MNLQARLRRLETELATANSELAKLRAKLGEQGVHVRRVERAWQDALALATQHIAYLPTTRRAAEEQLGLTNNRWENARALLRLAKVHNGRRWLTHDLATITEALDNAKALALAEPAAFRARLPRHARYGTRRA